MPRSIRAPDTIPHPLARLGTKIAASLGHTIAALTGHLLAFDTRNAERLPLAPLARRQWRTVNQRRIRSRCLALRVSDHVALCRVLGRFKMYVAADDYGHAAHLILDGYWEMHVTQVVAALVRPGMVAVDIGANQGYYTLLMAELVGPTGQVHAIEPNPRMTALLHRSVATNGLQGRVHIHPVPLAGPQARPMMLRIPDGLPSGAFLEHPGTGEVGVTPTTLDDLVKAPVHFIKIDAEGAEMDIWDGMTRLLDHGAPLTIILEFVLDRAPPAAAFLDETRSRGFSLAHIHPGRGLLPTTAEAILAAPSGQEWMLVLRRRHQPRDSAATPRT